ncbi:glycosyltransferase [Conexibacter sp. SYSU D00693]|uniref:glycosyltransferase n=1 Tax=Conexibacter sp. SYSU D00693 TaxID=2812560 RepID=UPI00196B2509|nr:glycosyltransferase [Conexibacter sp. SYSU D00693]
MRVLFASTHGAGHFSPLVPFARACEDAGHEVLVAAPPRIAEMVTAHGFAFWQLDDPSEERMGPVWSRVPSLSPDEANAVVIGEIFGRLNTEATLPRMHEAFASFAPDVVVREANQYSGALLAEEAGIPHACVGIGLAEVEALGRQLAAGPLDDVRRAMGLASDPDGTWLREAPYLTTFPASFEPAPIPNTLRFRDERCTRPRPDGPRPWGEDGRPLVYLTLGTVTGMLDAAQHAYDIVLEAVAGLPVSVLMTVGPGPELERFADAPANVEVLRWLPQEDVLPWADAVVCHGGSGSTTGALAAGVPLVVMPMFADQPQNAARVAAAGAGIAVTGHEPAPVRAAVERLLAEPSYGKAARRVAGEVAGHAHLRDAVALLEEFAARAARQPLTSWERLTSVVMGRVSNPAWERRRTCPRAPRKCRPAA